MIVAGFRALLLGCGLLAGTHAIASALEDGARAYGAGDYAAAANHWRPLAEAGDADAQFALGTLYQAGRGVAQSDAAATQWFRRAAEQGSVPAQYNLGNAFKHGRGVEASDEAAFHWWQKAARAGLAPAQFNVGTAYLYGRGVAQSADRGLAWYRKAAANGHRGAQAALHRLAALDASAAVADGQRISGADWIRNQPGNHYTVQLLAAEDEAAAHRFVASLPKGAYALGAYRSQGKRWVAVVSGSFPTDAAARRAARQWEPAVKPWVRGFSALQSRLSD